VKHDPLLDELKRFSAPFTWTELLRDKKVSKASRELLRRVAEEGWTEGLAIPFPRGETRFGLVSLAGARGPLSQEEKDGLSIMAMCLYEQVRRLGPSLGVALALSAMSCGSSTVCASLPEVIRTRRLPLFSASNSQPRMDT